MAIAEDVEVEATRDAVELDAVVAELEVPRRLELGAGALDLKANRLTSSRALLSCTKTTSSSSTSGVFCFLGGRPRLRARDGPSSTSRSASGCDEVARGRVVRERGGGASSAMGSSESESSTRMFPGMLLEWKWWAKDFGRLTVHEAVVVVVTDARVATLLRAEPNSWHVEIGHVSVSTGLRHPASEQWALGPRAVMLASS